MSQHCESKYLIRQGEGDWRYVNKFEVTSALDSALAMSANDQGSSAKLWVVLPDCHQEITMQRTYQTSPSVAQTQQRSFKQLELLLDDGSRQTTTRSPGANKNQWVKMETSGDSSSGGASSGYPQRTLGFGVSAPSEMRQPGVFKNDLHHPKVRGLERDKKLLFQDFSVLNGTVSKQTDIDEAKGLVKNHAEKVFTAGSADDQSAFKILSRCTLSGKKSYRVARQLNQVNWQLDKAASLRKTDSSDATFLAEVFMENRISDREAKPLIRKCNTQGLQKLIQGLEVAAEGKDKVELIRRRCFQ